MDHPRLRPHYGWIILAMGTLAVFGALGLGRFGYTAVLPDMQADLGLGNTQAGMLATANLIGYLILSALGGALASRYGARLLITAGLVLAGLGMVMTGLSGGLLSAALWRALTGMGSGASNISVMGMLTAWFAARRRGLATGIAVAGSSVGMIFTGLAVPHILAAYKEGWRICWFVFGGITFLLALGSYLFLRNKPSGKGLAPHAAGRAAEPAAGEPAAKIPWRKIYRSAQVWHLGLVYIAFGLSYIIFMTFFVKRLVADAGYTKQAALGLYMAMGWSSLFCGVIWGALSDAIGRKRVLLIVYLIQSASFGLFALAPNRACFALAAVLFGLTAWSIPAIMAAACGDILGARLAPAALGFITLFFGLGQALGPSLAGAMADAAGSFRPAFLLASAVALVGALGAGLLKPGYQENEFTAS